MMEYDFNKNLYGFTISRGCLTDSVNVLNVNCIIQQSIIVKTLFCVK